MKKNKIWILIIGIVAIVLLFSVQQRKEYKKWAGERLIAGYTGSTCCSQFIYNGNPRGQTFVSLETFDLSYINLKLGKFGSPPGPLLVSIRNVDASGLPTGSDLISTSIPISSIISGVNQINMPTYKLLQGNNYAVVLQMNNGDGSNFVRIYYDTAGTYSGGDYLASLVNKMSGYDSYFEVYGTTPQTPTCSDGTPYNVCSTDLPVYCDNGVLVERCSLCGCPSGYPTCEADGQCTTTSFYPAFLLEKYAYINGGLFSIFITNSNKWIDS